MQPATLLKTSSSIQQWPGSSSILITTPVPINANRRAFYLNNITDVPPPVISASEFVPRSLLTHLMRAKKDRAITVKYVSGDEISNMEGVLHTFVTPVVRIMMFGDYVFKGGHGVSKFTPDGGKQRARAVLMSAAVQMDFENRKVMLAASKLEDEGIPGKLLDEDFMVMSAADKQDVRKRAEYDLRLRKHMIANLTRNEYLPSRTEAQHSQMTQTQALGLLEEYIAFPEPNPEIFVGKCFELDDSWNEVLSLDSLYNTALHQLRNEFSALEILAPQGYIYTYDPAAIFARKIGADFLNRLMLAALKTLSEANSFPNMRAYAFNDYADRGALNFVKHALRKQEHMVVLSKSDLFKGTGDYYDPSGIDGGENTWLVVHNNSDAFGQNIETEGSSSLDGALGWNSSAAASLDRKRDDLLNNLF